ncbi:uncharacterized protein [Panulirus ornatus]|uniref:uncharacterized protein n=1 Tax=Panulirus ornatus TaxID=150431 RepID=UPI003A86E752
MVSPVGIHPRGSKRKSPDVTSSRGGKMASPSVRSSTSRAMASCPSVTSSSRGIKAASPGVISSPEGKKMASPGVIPSGGGKVACPGVTSSPRGSKMTSPGGTLTIAANTLLITSQVILCLGSPTSQTSGPASSSPQSSSFHYALSSLHGSPSPHRGVTSPHSNPSHPGTSQPAVESGLPADGNLTSTEKVALTEGHYNDVRFTDFSRFSQAFNLTLPPSLQTPRLENSTARSGEGNSWMNGNETGGINSPGGNPGDDEERVRESKKHEVVQSKNGSRIDVIQRLFNHSFQSTLPDLQEHTADTHTAPSGDTHSLQTWGLSKKGTRLSTIPKDETSGRVTDNTIDTFGVREVRNLKTLHHLSSVREDEDSLASLESLPKPGTKVSFLRSTTRFTGPPVTRPRGEEPAFIHVREMMVNSPRSLEQEYPSEDSTLEQEGVPSENNHLQEALSEDRRLLEGPSEDHLLQEGLSEDHLLQEGLCEDHLLQDGPSEDQLLQEGLSEDRRLLEGPSEDHLL